jgi:two-component system sensor histidine kinase KdpD
LGVLGVKPSDPAVLLPQEQRRLLESFASQSALAIERVQFAEQAKQTQVLQATEKLQTALLNSISHDLRTPLVSITGTLSTLQEDGNDPIRQSMIETAYAEARRLNHLVGNLLDMTRIEAGAMRVRQVPCDVQDIIGSALEQLSDRLKGRRVTVELSSPLPLVPMDFVLVVQVLANLLENAVKYSPSSESIEVQACVTEGSLQVRVADRGIGIPAADLNRVFDKFYRVRRPDGVIGTGLGLSICKGIVEAHHGKIWAENREGGGTVMTIMLPLRSGGKHE